jgi:hypothetical protein
VPIRLGSAMLRRGHIRTRAVGANCVLPSRRAPATPAPDRWTSENAARTTSGGSSDARPRGAWEKLAVAPLAPVQPVSANTAAARVLLGRVALWSSAGAMIAPDRESAGPRPEGD